MKRIVHYIDLKIPVVLGTSALVKPVDHPEPAANNRWIESGTVDKVTRGSHGPLFETLAYEWRPIEPTGYALKGLDVDGFSGLVWNWWRELIGKPRGSLGGAAIAMATEYA